MTCHQKLDSKTSQCFWDNVPVGGCRRLGAGEGQGCLMASDTNDPTKRTRLSWINVLLCSCG